MSRLLALALLITSACAPAPLPAVQSEGDAPERVGVRSEPLAAMLRYVRSERINLHHVSILRGGQYALDSDFYPYMSDVPHDVASVTKSITSTLVGIALDRREIADVEAPVVSFFPDVPYAPSGGRMERLTLKHLLTMTSGFCSDFGGGEAQLDAMRTAPDAVRFMLGQPLLHEPGEHFAYCSGASQLLSAIVTQATGLTMHDYARAHLFGPLGIGEVIWPADPQGNNTGWGDLFIRPRDLAKIGQLFLQRGQWEGHQVVSQAWIEAATSEQVTDGDEGYGYRWWIPNSLPGLYEARGRGGQRLVVWPDRDLVVVMIGSGFDPGELGGFIVEAVTDKASLPPSPEAYGALQAEMTAASIHPPIGPSAPLSPIAQSISGVRYELASNEIGLTHFRIDFSDADTALFRLGLAVTRSDEFGERVTTVGLDGRYRISPSSRFGLPLAARGFWADEYTFRMEYDEFAANHLYDIVLRFEGDAATLSLSEATGLFDTTISAVRAQ